MKSGFKLKKSSVGRMLIAVYVLVVLGLSATAKAEVQNLKSQAVPCFEN
jgi:hypothetical protein